MVTADVIIDMPPPPAVETAAPASETTDTLVRFARRDVAEDAAGRPRGVHVARQIVDQFPGCTWPDWSDGWNFGWPGYWAIQPLYWGGGWTFPPASMPGPMPGLCGGSSFTWTFGSTAVNMRLGNIRW